MRRRQNENSEPPPLEAAVERWVKMIMSQPDAHGMAVPGSGIGLIISSEAEAVLLEIGQQLGKRTPFSGPSDLAHFLLNSIPDAARETAPNLINKSAVAAAVAPAITRRLKEPLQIFYFRVPLALNGDLPFSLTAGGQNDLKIEYGDTELSNAVKEKHNILMTLSGRVAAVTEPAAIVAIEQLVASTGLLPGT